MGRERYFHLGWIAIWGWLALLGCQETTCPGLDATLWHQHSEEYETLCSNLYAHATLRLREAMNDATWSADLSQMGRTHLPQEMAVVLDLDETVLNNAPLFARVMKKPVTNMGKAWADWAREASALPIAGAVPFVRHALDKGVYVFFVSNRSCRIDDATRKNMAQAGFPVDHPKLVFLSRNVDFNDVDKVEKCPALEATVATRFGVASPRFYLYKGERRRLIAAKYRVLLFIGDSQGDFHSISPMSASSARERERLLKARLTPEERSKINKSYGRYFHDRWMQLPNAMYGNWLSSRTGYRALPIGEVVQQRLSLLNLN